MPVALLAFVLGLFVAASPASAGSCTIMGEPNTTVPVYGKPAGPQTGSVKAGIVMTAMGGGHDTSGQTWILVGQGATRGWIERTKLVCS